MQKLCCVRTRQHPLPVWSHKFVPQFNNSYLNQFSSISGGNCISWHWKLGHANFQWIQTLCRHSNSDSKRCVLPTKLDKTSSCPAPKCAACMLGKQAQQTPTLSIGHHLPNKDLLLKTNHLNPGDCVSLDQYQSSIPGHLEHTYATFFPMWLIVLLRHNRAPPSVDHNFFNTSSPAVVFVPCCSMKEKIDRGT